MSRNFKVSSRLKQQKSRLGLEAIMSRLGRFGPRSSSGLRCQTTEEMAGYAVVTNWRWDKSFGFGLELRLGLELVVVLRPDWVCERLGPGQFREIAVHLSTC